MRKMTLGSILVLLGFSSLACTVEAGDVAAPAQAPAVAALSEPPLSTSLASIAESMGPALDPRPSRLRPRPFALADAEVTELEALWRDTPKGDAARPALARRLAETYVELESAALHDARLADVQRARESALRYYDLLVDEYASDPKLDEVLYYVAREYELAKNFPATRKAYFELIMKRPDSRYVPKAYLSFGELFFDEGSSDATKWELAKMAYRKVIAFPPPNNEVYGYAWFKLGHSFWKSGELDKALRAFKKTIDYGTTFPQIPGATRLAEVARTDLVALCRDRHDESRACASGELPPEADETAEPAP